jgi:hypothetical protein
MIYKYVNKGDFELEEKARKHPYMFGPSSYAKINSFMAGTQIVFAERPLKEWQGELCLHLIDSYLYSLPLSLSDDSYFHYRGAAFIQYVWFQRRHEFHLMGSKADLRVYHPIYLGGQIVVVGSKVAVTDTTNGRIDLLNMDNIPAVIEMASIEYEKHINRVLGIDERCRVSVRINFDHDKVNIRTSY